MLYQHEGEIAFARDLRDRVIEHVRSHPREFVLRTGKRILDFWTQPSYFRFYSILIAIAAVFGLLLACCTGGEWFSFASVLVLYPLLYYFTYTFSRYRHPIEPVMYVLAKCLRETGALPQGIVGRQARGIRQECWMRVICLYDPDFAIAEITHELVISCPHVAGPNHVRGVNIRAVEDPVDMGRVSGRVVNNYQLLARQRLQLFYYRIPFQISSLPEGLDLRIGGDGGDA